MQIKFLKTIVEDLIGKPPTPIIDLLHEKKDVNEFTIAKKLDLTINQTRNILYKLSDYGLVSFIRKKDKKKGWYIYFWTLNTYKSLKLLEENLKKESEELKKELENRTKNQFYTCNTCMLEVSEENALLNNFACPECEEIYEVSEGAGLKQQIEKRINKIKKEMELVSEERKKEEEKLGKKNEKKIQKAEKEKTDKRAAKKKETAKRKAKEKKEEEKNNPEGKIEKTTKTKIKKTTKKKPAKPKKKPAKKKEKSSKKKIKK